MEQKGRPWNGEMARWAAAATVAAFLVLAAGPPVAGTHLANSAERCYEPHAPCDEWDFVAECGGLAPDDITCEATFPDSDLVKFGCGWADGASADLDGRVFDGNDLEFHYECLIVAGELISGPAILQDNDPHLVDRLGGDAEVAVCPEIIQCEEDPDADEEPVGEWEVFIRQRNV